MSVTHEDQFGREGCEAPVPSTKETLKDIERNIIKI